MGAREGAVLQLRSNDDGSIVITVAPARDDERFTIDEATLALTVWSEAPDVIRGRFEHRPSGAVAYFQSSDTSFRRFTDCIHLVVSRPES